MIELDVVENVPSIIQNTRFKCVGVFRYFYVRYDSVPAEIRLLTTTVLDLLSPQDDFSNGESRQPQCEMANVEQWDQPCSNDELCKISQSVSDWKAVAPSLRLKKADEDAIIGYAPYSVPSQRMEMLRTWKERLGTGATYRKLSDAFKMCQRQDLVDELSKLVTARAETTPDTPPVG